MKKKWSYSNFMAALSICVFSLGILSPIFYVGAYESGRPSGITRTRQAAETPGFVRNDDLVDFSGVTFTPWNVEEASKYVEKREKKPYTIMVYMNGSDLESEEGAATNDLIEMLESGIDTKLANIVIFTGGTNRWQNDVIPDNECVVWEIKDGLLYEITGVGLINMGNAGTLSSFINFGMKNFPANNYGLIMWDHGGGSIAGYGHDEKFNEDNLTLLDINYALKQSPLSNQKLEFLGFDSCLMATAEMAIIASDYAKYFIASEDLEPGDGWNYTFLSAINDNPNISGKELGMEIVDCFMDYYGRGSDEILTLSVTDLSKVSQLGGALEQLMARCSESLTDKDNFNSLARRRNGTKTFGDGSPRDNDCDMVDIGDMAVKLSDMFPYEASQVISDLNKCVVYNRHNSGTDLKGLSVYYIYGGKKNGRSSLELYDALKTNNEHTRYLGSFFGRLVSGGSTSRTRSAGQSADAGESEMLTARLTLWQPLEKEKGVFVMTGIQQNEKGLMGEDTSWPAINGQNVCMYEINRSSDGATYAVPATRNGEDCDIVLFFGKDCPEGKILGARKEDGLIIQKGFDEIKEGDKIAFHLEKRLFSESGSVSMGWHITDEITVVNGLTLRQTTPALAGNSFLGVLKTDIKGNRYFTSLKSV